METKTQPNDIAVDLNTESTSTTLRPAPEKVIRDGAIAASIWRRDGKNGVFYEYSLSRAWKSEETGKSGYAQNFSAKSEEQLLGVIKKATDWIKGQGGTSTQDSDAGANQ